MASWCFFSILFYCRIPVQVITIRYFFHWVFDRWYRRIRCCRWWGYLLIDIPCTLIIGFCCCNCCLIFNLNVCLCLFIVLHKVSMRPECLNRNFFCINMCFYNHFYSCSSIVPVKIFVIEQVRRCCIFQIISLVCGSRSKTACDIFIPCIKLNGINRQAGINVILDYNLGIFCGRRHVLFNFLRNGISECLIRIRKRIVQDIFLVLIGNCFLWVRVWVVRVTDRDF